MSQGFQTFDLNHSVKIPQLIAPEASANITTVPMKPKRQILHPSGQHLS